MQHLNRNFAGCDEYSVDSFLGLYHEEAVWNDDEYFKLENDIYALASEYSGSSTLQREVAWPVMRLFSYLMLSLGSHCDPNDGFKIKNISDEQFYSRRERVQLVFEGVFKGEMPKREFLTY